MGWPSAVVVVAGGVIMLSHWNSWSLCITLIVVYPSTCTHEFCMVSFIYSYRAFAWQIGT